MKKALRKFKNFALHSSSGKLFIAFLSVALVVWAGSTETFSYLLTTPNTSNGGAGIKEEYSYPSIKCSIQGQDTGKTAVKQVTIIPDTNINCYIRAAVILTWQHDDPNQPGVQKHVFGTLPKEFADYFEIQFSQDGWQEGSDGYYYGTAPFKPNDTPPVLIINCERGAREAPKGYTLSLEVFAEAIQAEPSNAVETAWGIKVKADGTLEV